MSSCHIQDLPYDILRTVKSFGTKKAAMCIRATSTHFRNESRNVVVIKAANKPGASAVVRMDDIKLITTDNFVSSQHVFIESNEIRFDFFCSASHDGSEHLSHVSVTPSANSKCILSLWMPIGGGGLHSHKIFVTGIGAIHYLPKLEKYELVQRLSYLLDQS